MKELIIGQIPPNFDIEKHIPISPLCFSGKEDLYPELGNFEFVDPFHDFTVVAYYDKLICEEALSYVELFARKYNPEFYNKYSFRFWKSIYFFSIYISLGLIKRHEMILDSIINKFKLEPIYVRIKANPEISFKSLIEQANSGNIILQEDLFSILIRKHKPNGWNIEYNTAYSKQKTTVKAHYSIRLLLLGIKKSLSKLFYRSKSGHGISVIESIIFHFLFSFKPALKKHIFEKKKYQLPNKKEFFDDSFSLIDLLISDDIKNIEKLLKKLEKKTFVKGKISLISNSLFYSLEERILNALKSEKKELIIVHQHGGHSYGSAFNFFYNNEIEYDQDWFISWGWNKISGVTKKNIIALPSPYLSKIYNKHSTKNDKIILVGTEAIILTMQFESFPSGQKAIDYRNSKILFLSKIESSNLLTSILYKPYPERDCSLQDESFVLRKYPGLRILKSNLHKEIKGCKLLVLDHPGTTWNIAMAMNTPVICFWEKEHFNFNIEANRYLDKFKELELYFENPISAANKVINLMNNSESIYNWWNSHDIQALRKEWMNIYARADNKWLRIWMKSLWSLK